MYYCPRVLVIILLVWLIYWKLIKYVAIIEWGFCRIWRILQIEEGVIRRGRRPRWVTQSEICRILHMLRKPNSIIALLFILNISPFLKEFRHYALCFSAHQNNTTLAQVFSVNGSIIWSGLHFWRHFDVIGSIIFSDCTFDVIGLIFGQQQLVVVNYACGFNQSETEKYILNV